MDPTVPYLEEVWPGYDDEGVFCTFVKKVRLDP